jgi:hypothetical protein
MKRFAQSVVRYIAALVFALLGSLFSLWIGTVAFLIVIAVRLSKQRPDRPRWRKPVLYLAVALGLGAWFARYGLQRAQAPLSCADLTPRLIRAFMPAVPAPEPAVTTPQAAFARQINGEIVRLLRQIDDIKDATTLITDARRIAQYSESEASSASLRMHADALEGLLRSTGLLAQSDIEVRASRLQKTLDDWHQTVTALQPDSDFTTLRRDFNDAVVQDSFDQVTAGLIELRNGINRFVAQEGLTTEQRVVAYFDEAASMWVLNESIWFTGRTIDLIELDAGDVVKLSEYEGAPNAEVLIGAGAGALPAQPKSIPIPPNQGAVELRIVRRVPGFVAPACGVKTFSTAVPLSRTDLRWFQGTDTLVRGRVRLPKAGLDNVPFTMTIDKTRPVTDVALPQYSMFAASAPTESKGPIRYENRFAESVAVNGDAVTPQSLSIRPLRFELLPRIFRNRWVAVAKDLLFPLNALLASAYLFVVALLSEYLFRKY